jgi:hypothetical protein
MPDTVVAYIHKDEWSHSFGRSLSQLTAQNVGGHVADIIDARSNAGGLPEARNRLMEYFLDETEHDWLLFIDTDMGFKPSALAALHQVADVNERPIVGGLCFAQRDMANDGRGGYRWNPRPTIFDFQPDAKDSEMFAYRVHYPVNGILQCDATGGAFVLIHRRVGAEMRAVYGDEWFTRIIVDGGRVSEDLSFFKRWHDMHGRGGCHVHTGVRITHAKTTWIDERDFWDDAPVFPASEECDVIVPVLHRPQNVAPFMTSLRASNGLSTAWFVCEVDDIEQQAAVTAAGGKVLKHNGTFAEKVNYALTRPALKAPWVFLTGDDVMFHPGWLDHAQHVAKAYQGLVVGTNDLGNPRVMNGDHATHLLIRRKYIDEIGASWDGPGVCCHEGYRHWYVDDEIVAAAKQRGVFQMALGSYVEHMHPYWGKGEPDDVYELGQSQAEQDRATFTERTEKFAA